MSAIPATQRKLQHAHETFQLLQVSACDIPLESEEVARRLSDFLSAADSVVDLMAQESGRVHRGWVTDWRSQRSADDKALLSFMTKQRNAETHGQGATIRTTTQKISYPEYLRHAPAMQSGRHGGYYYGPQWSGPYGMESPRTPVEIEILMLGDEEVVEKCKRYLGLLKEMVQAYLTAYQRP
jgi:hypothetical protein